MCYNHVKSIRVCTHQKYKYMFTYLCESIAVVKMVSPQIKVAKLQKCNFYFCAACQFFFTAVLYWAIDLYRVWSAR